MRCGLGEGLQAEVWKVNSVVCVGTKWASAEGAWSAVGSCRRGPWRGGFGIGVERKSPGSFSGKDLVQEAGAIAYQACWLLVSGWCGRKDTAFLGQRR